MNTLTDLIFQRRKNEEIAMLRAELSQCKSELEKTRKERDEIENEVDDLWLDEIARQWNEMFGKPYDTLDGETRIEGISANISKLFNELEETRKALYLEW